MQSKHTMRNAIPTQMAITQGSPSVGNERKLAPVAKTTQLQKQTHTLTYISDLLANNPEQARQEALRYRTEVFWDDIVRLFEGIRGDAHKCSRCGREDAGWFNPLTLRWIEVSDVCHNCKVSLTMLHQEAIVRKWRERINGRMDSVLRNCGVPQRYLTADISSVNREVAEVVQGVLQWLHCGDGPQSGIEPGVADPDVPPTQQQASGGLYIFGPPATGKTYLAAAILKAYIRTLTPSFRDCYSEAPIEPRYPIFTIVSDMLADIRKTFNTPDLSEGDIYDKYCSAPLVVMDDFMAEKVTGWSVKTMYSIINRRYINNLPLIIISNYGLGEVERSFNAVSEFTGTSVVLRISEMGKVLILRRGLLSLSQGSLTPQRHTAQSAAVGRCKGSATPGIKDTTGGR
ncbi:hypothetical protein [Candidatus Magnetobacterium casense]|uniref:Uncharacterized protein n=1 Tax=Candidatus Magnetobacterium casense TaxID=1455061 RepID=A0ABS6S3K2_9BACT|nr:hypothetical protein [Candidatus Magnetobacterium casensis]MBV6342938.1 hypothetical protein [Candidatus Magnetobacterium casensis]